jgi:hypothetical protein
MRGVSSYRKRKKTQFSNSNRISEENQIMKLHSSNVSLVCRALALAVLLLTGSAVFAQDKKVRKTWSFCDSNNYSYNNRISFKEMRETTVRAGSLLEVDGKRNGGVQVKGEDRSDVLVRACIQATGTTEQEAQALAKNVRIETSPNIRAENSGDEAGWAVSYEILVPRSTNLKLLTHNGGISIDSVDGTLEFEAHNGGINLVDVAGDVKGKTTNGGVNVKLSGNSWKGTGLDVETKNGGVNLTLSETYAARIETGTINGGFKSDIAALNTERNERTRGIRLNTELNGGGAPVRIITTNGGVRINSN